MILVAVYDIFPTYFEGIVTSYDKAPFIRSQSLLGSL